MLGHFLAVALSFPSVVYTMLLGIALVYWMTVMIGAAHIDLLGGGEGGAEGAADGIDGAHADVGGADGADGADGDGGDGGDAHDGAFSGVLASLKLRSAPVTVVLSVFLLFGWILSIFGMQAVAAWLPGFAPGLTGAAVLLLAGLLALPITSVVIRPLAPIFAPPVATKSASLVGKVATVRTGTVTDRFGEALLEDGGAGLVVRVRVDTGDTLKRGDQVVITAYDQARHEYTVAPMHGLLDERDLDKGQEIDAEEPMLEASKEREKRRL